MSRDPLSETLFRPTTLDALAAERVSDPGDAADRARRESGGTVAPAGSSPARTRGTRVRAGNAMSRTRAAVLAGAARAVAQDGTRITMSQVAVESGVAKATLYNHFRTREAVLDAVVVDQVQALAREAQGRSLPDVLARTALALAEHPLRQTLAEFEPGTLADLATINPDAAGWRAAREAIEQTLAADRRAGADTVLRWLASFLLSPATPAAIADDVAVLVTGLPLAARTPEADRERLASALPSRDRFAHLAG